MPFSVYPICIVLLGYIANGQNSTCNGGFSQRNLNIFSASNDVQFNHNGIGWYYDLFPCDMDNYEEWPFFILSHHVRRYGKRNPSSSVDKIRLILNTKPVPWIIDMGTSLEITVGTDASGQTSADFNTRRRYRERNPLVIKYDDGQTIPQYGELQIFSVRGSMVAQLYNVGYYGYPRTCHRGTKSGSECGEYVCEGQVITITNRRKQTLFSCPSCLGNIACGLMGKYESGDCTETEMADSNSACYHVLQGSDGIIYTPPTASAAIFDQFANTWQQTVVDAAITAAANPQTVQSAAYLPKGITIITDNNYHNLNYLFVLYAILGLSIINIACCIVYCYNKQTNRKTKYEPISLEYESNET